MRLIPQHTVLSNHILSQHIIVFNLSMFQVEVPAFSPDEVVRIMDDMKEVEKLQTRDHGGWNDDMAMVKYT